MTVLVGMARGSTARLRIWTSRTRSSASSSSPYLLLIFGKVKRFFMEERDSSPGAALRCSTATASRSELLECR
jgi:hypothetical protein